MATRSDISTEMQIAELENQIEEILVENEAPLPEDIQKQVDDLQELIDGLLKTLGVESSMKAAVVRARLKTKLNM